MRRVSLLVLVAVLGLTACGDDDDDTAAQDGGAGEAAEVTALEVTETDFAFEHPPSVPEGPVRIDATNEGEQEHVLIVQRLEPGTTFGEVQELLADPEAIAPVETVFGVSGLSPGAAGNSTAVLEAGEYVMICPIPDAADGVPHFVKGMISPLTVEEREATAALPETDVTITGVEFGFQGVPENFEAGETTIEFRNGGDQEHELNLVELEGDATIDDVVAFYEAPGAGPPPMRNLGGALIGAGVRDPAVTSFELEAGKRYVFICAVPDFADQPPVPHVAKGMRSEVIEIE